MLFIILARALIPVLLTANKLPIRVSGSSPLRLPEIRGCVDDHHLSAGDFGLHISKHNFNKLCGRTIPTMPPKPLVMEDTSERYRMSSASPRHWRIAASSRRY
jgi:hypothetical protein